MGALTNFLLSIYILRTLGATQFGAFTLAYVTYGFAINASRGLSVEPLLIRFSATDLRTWRRAVAGCTGTALLVGLATGACALAAGLIVGGTTRLAFLALGLTLPGLMLQDSWRHSFFALGRAHLAFINDAIWAAVQIPLVAFLTISGHKSVFWFVLAWGVAASVAAAIGPLQARVLPNLAGARDWLSQHRDLGPRYLAENTGGNVGDTLRSYSLSSILGLAAVGYIQAANTLLGPFKIIYYGVSLITIPEAARLLRRSPRRLPLLCAVISTALLVLAMVWGAALLVALPRGLGHLMFGSAPNPATGVVTQTWRLIYPLLLPATVAVMSMCANTGPFVGLHALGAARRSLRAALIGSALILASALAGAVIAGTLGTMRYAAGASWVGTLVVWWEFRQALRDTDTIPIPGWMWPARSAGSHRRPAGPTPGTTAVPEREVPRPERAADENAARFASREVSGRAGRARSRW